MGSGFGPYEPNNFRPNKPKPKSYGEIVIENSNIKIVKGDCWKVLKKGEIHIFLKENSTCLVTNISISLKLGFMHPFQYNWNCKI